ncbi:MAG: hypothetical protein DMG70_20850 [Acidobacteria bacterium]|nr:MAG: hypothetical protein DMG70_20850 [Acidobacteriota bacterium]PYY11794.1 MAG: hypothetical protein DMG69_03125 [Acidobacteriota bacterium]
MYVSTLRRFVEAMGGELVISAHFADGAVRINQFENVDDPSRRREAEEPWPSAARTWMEAAREGGRFDQHQPDIVVQRPKPGISRCP